jgi:hypothetical protein
MLKTNFPLPQLNWANQPVNFQGINVKIDT